MTDAEEAFGYVFSPPEGGITPLGGPREGGGTRAMSGENPADRKLLAAFQAEWADLAVAAASGEKP